LVLRTIYSSLHADAQARDSDDDDDRHLLEADAGVGGLCAVIR
jgi:hypothetical protein